MRSFKRIHEATAKGKRGTLRALLRDYLDHRQASGAAEATLFLAGDYLMRFVVFCETRSVFVPTEVTVEFLERYQHYVSQRRKDDGEPLSARSQGHLLMAVRLYCAWLTKKGHTLFNPALDLELPKEGRRLLRNVMTVEEVEKLLAAPDVKTASGLRDRAMMELLYSTGIRRKELASLKLERIDFEKRTVFVLEGKGKRDRVVPIGKRALLWLRRYLDEVRPWYLSGNDEGFVFLSNAGTPLTEERITQRVKECQRQAGVVKPGSAHTLRHTAATLMLENGADVRMVQEFLGHTSLNSTQRYTHVSIRKLKEVHERTHPSAKLRAPRAETDAQEADSSHAAQLNADTS